MTRNKTFAVLAMLLMVVATVVSAGTPNTPTLDGTVNVGSEWVANELTDSITVANLGFDFGPTKAPVDMYVTFDATNLYIGITGDNSDSPAFGNDCYIIYLDTTPGAGTNPGPFSTVQIGYANGYSTVDCGGSALDGGPRVFFPDAFRPDFLLGARYNDAGNKIAGNASNTYGPGMWSLTNLSAPDNDDAGLDVNVVRGPNIEFSVPWAALYGGTPPANAAIGIFGMVSSRDWMASRTLPQLAGTPPINNPGQNNVLPNSDPGLSGFRRVSITDGAGAFLTGAITSSLVNTFSGVPMDVSSVSQVFNASTLQVNFTDGLVLDNNAQTVGNYTVTVGGSPATLSSAQIGVSNKDIVYLTLSAPATAGQAISVTVSTAVTGNGGSSTLGGPDTVSTTAQRRVLWTMDRSASGEDSLTIAGPFSEPFIRGAWDGFSGRIQFSDAADAFADIPGTQALGTGGDDIYEAVAFISDAAAHEYIINSEVPNAPGSDGGANQFVGVGYWMNTPYNLTLATSATAINLVDDVWNRRLIQDTTVSFIARFPSVEANGYWATPAELQSATVRLQGGTRLGGFSPEGVIEPMVTGGATSGSPMQFIGQDGAGFSYYFGQITFPAGVLDVFEFRLVANGIVGAIDAYEDQDGDTASVHQHTARATNFDRVTPNDQFVTWEVISYDVNPTVANITAADNWDLFE